MARLNSTGIRGIVLSANSATKLNFWRDGAVCWDSTGTITYAGSWALRPQSQRKWTDCRGDLVLPGFIDVHAHLPQYPVVGHAGHALLPWLTRYIFPTERRFTPQVAETQAPRFFSALKERGITSSGIFTNIHGQSTDVCFQAAESSGLRVVMGVMMMDTHSYSSLSPKRQMAKALSESEDLCGRWHQRDGGRLRYAFSPRFAVTCSRALMEGAGKLANQANAFIQTHLSENLQELEVVAKLFPWARDYTDVYETCGLLGPRTIVGHAIHLSSREYRALARTGTKVAHCPSSNLFLGSGVMAVEKMKRAGISFGLGNDVAAGPELCPWEVMKAGAYSHSARRMFVDEAATPSLVELFHLATNGGAEVFGQKGQLGQLKAGFDADVAVWDASGVLPYGRAFLELKDGEEMLAQMIYRGSRARVRHLWVRGNPV